jgi:DNA-binding IclR family transcriptional regulator
VLSRATRLLHSFGETEPELDLTQLTRRTGLPRSTVHRLAAELVALGHLDRSDDGKYSIGIRLWELGELAAVSIRLRETALPHLLALFAATGENVHLAVLDGTEALYVARLTGSASIPTLSRMGGRLPLHTTGVGKALLSTMDEAWLERYFALPRERETIHSITDEQALRGELTDARRLGYASTRQEMTLGNISFAAPLHAISGLPRAAVGVVTHLARGDASRLAPLVVRAASEIGHDLSH